MQNIVTDTDADAKKAIAFLKRCNGGRATFLPIATIKARDFNERGLEQCEGFIGIASELCSCKDCYKGILASLLGRIVIAENLDCAVNIAKRYSYRFKVVTLDGQVVNAVHLLVVLLQKVPDFSAEQAKSKVSRIRHKSLKKILNRLTKS